MNNKECMQKAAELALSNGINGFKDGGPFGAIITDKYGNIKGIGKNQVILNNDPTAHAEIMAIRDAGLKLGTHDLKDLILYTSCYPCPMCMAAIMWSGIRKIYYANTQLDANEIGFRDEKFYEMIKNDNYDDFKIIKLNNDDAKKSFLEYKNSVSKIEY